MDSEDCAARFGAVFQDFVRYQFSAAENIGLGDVERAGGPRAHRARRRRGAAQRRDRRAAQGYDTMLGRLVREGAGALGGAVAEAGGRARVHARDAEVLILDEPTASIDAEAEHALFERFKALAADRIAIVISHRFSTVRMADRIAVLHDGQMEELGSHAS